MVKMDLDMESTEEFMGSSDQGQIMKGKRTKRQRPSSPFGLAVTSSSSSSGGGGGRDEFSIPSPMVSGETYESTTEEEEDMANCLILLAQGDHRLKKRKEEKFNTRKFTETATTTTTVTTTTTATGKAGFFVYECKTCNRTFPSFQALGGHRASHKKPKSVMAEEKKQVTGISIEYDHYEEKQNIKISPSILSLGPIANNKPSIHGNNKSSKIHECSICGSEFASGQALGGHMRRHRTVTSNQIAMNAMDTSLIDSHDQDTEIKPRNILPLDLNLPAPEDHDHQRETNSFQFTSNQSPLVFSTPALVDCHY